MRLHKVTNALVIDLDKLSGVRLENLEYPDRFSIFFKKIHVLFKIIFGESILMIMKI